MKTAVLLLSLLFTSFRVGAQAPTHPQVTAAQAKALVLESLTPGERKLPGLAAEPDDNSSSRPFLFYIVTWAGTKDGSVVVGNYAVDPNTADVFSSTSACDEKKNKSLQKLQSHIRAGLHLSAAQYKNIKTSGPLCE